MGEIDEDQVKFREDARGWFAKDKLELEHLNEKLDKLEKIVLHGNGSPALVTQIAELRTRLDGMDKRMDSLDEMKGEIADIKSTLSEIQGQMKADAKNKANWVGFGLVILTIIGTAVLEKFFK